MSYPPQGYPQQNYPPNYSGYTPPPPPGQGPEAMMMPATPPTRRFGILRAMLLSPFSPDVWRDVGQTWRGIGLLYMLVLLLITWLAVMIKGYSSFAHFTDVESRTMIEQVPAIHIKDGVVTADCDQPYVISDPQTKRPFAIIDTTGQTTEPPKQSPSVLLTRSSLIMRNNTDEVRTHDLSKVKSFSLDKNDVYRWMGIFKKCFLPVFLPLMVVFSLIGRLVLMLIASVFGLIFNSMFSAEVPFGALMRLSALAMTPTILLSTMLTLAGVPMVGCFWTIGGIAVVLFYLAMMVKANADAFRPAPPPWQMPPPPTGAYMNYR